MYVFLHIWLFLYFGTFWDIYDSDTEHRQVNRFGFKYLWGPAREAASDVVLLWFWRQFLTYLDNDFFFKLPRYFLLLYLNRSSGIQAGPVSSSRPVTMLPGTNHCTVESQPSPRKRKPEKRDRLYRNSTRSFVLFSL